VSHTHSKQNEDSERNGKINKDKFIKLDNIITRNHACAHGEP